MGLRSLPSACKQGGQGRKGNELRDLNANRGWRRTVKYPGGLREWTKLNFPHGRDKDAKERKERRGRVVTESGEEVLRWEENEL